MLSHFVYEVTRLRQPRTIRQAYSCATGRVINLTAYCASNTAQSLTLCSQSGVNTAHLRTCTCHKPGQGWLWPTFSSRDNLSARTLTMKSSLPSREFGPLSARALALGYLVDDLGMHPYGMVGFTGSRRIGAEPASRPAIFNASNNMCIVHTSLRISYQMCTNSHLRTHGPLSTSHTYMTTETSWWFICPQLLHESHISDTRYWPETWRDVDNLH